MRRPLPLLTILAFLLATLGIAPSASAHYDPTVGRWLERDPIGYADSPSLFQPVLSAPVSYSDPTGLQGTAPGVPALVAQAAARGDYQLIAQLLNISIEAARALAQLILSREAIVTLVVAGTATLERDCPSSPCPPEKIAACYAMSVTLNKTLTELLLKLDERHIRDAVQEFITKQKSVYHNRAWDHLKEVSDALDGTLRRLENLVKYLERHPCCRTIGVREKFDELLKRWRKELDRVFDEFKKQDVPPDFPFPKPTPPPPPRAPSPPRPAPGK